MTSPTLHRRKSSKDEDEIIVIPPPPVRPVSSGLPELKEPLSPASSPSRSRVNSNPLHPIGHSRSPSSGGLLPSSASPYKTTFSFPRSPMSPNGPSSSIIEQLPPSPFRNGFSISGPPRPSPLNGHSHSQPQSNSHSRARSISTPFSPVLPSPLAVSAFSTHDQDHPGHSHVNGHTPHHHHQQSDSLSVPFSFPPILSASKSAPFEHTNGSSLLPTTAPQLPFLATQNGSVGSVQEPGSPTTARHNRRHSRLHSRNLSIFFPRPGSLPTSSISEDGAQELELGGPVDVEAVPMPSAKSSVSIISPSLKQKGRPPLTPLGAGFTFGGKPPSDIDAPQSDQPLSGTKTRRGHHHKHSMSHNFFSFLEPGSNIQQAHSGTETQELELHTQPTPDLVSPWQPMSPWPKTPASAQLQIPNALAAPKSPSPAPSNVSTLSIQSAPAYTHQPTYSSSTLRFVSILQFFLGASLWVSGQQNGSLSCTGLGYWVVFDALGVGMKGWSEYWGVGVDDAGTGPGGTTRRFYGNRRTVTVFIFAQAVYLMFASVYVCKETVEHVLLSMGETHGEGGHHHHHDLGIDFPWLLTTIAALTILGTAIRYQNHSKLVTISGNRIPPLGSFIRSITRPRTNQSLSYDPIPTTPLGLALTNPYVASPLMFCAAILCVTFIIDEAHHQTYDLGLATLITAVTGKVAYRACVVLGTVLLQTAPRRSLPGGRMENFLRAMKDIEKHPDVLHLPAPHIWQLTPANLITAPVPARGYGKDANDIDGTLNNMVATVELHVRKDLGDDAVLQLTRWAWEKCASALSSSGLGTSLANSSGKPGDGGPEVTVGIVRG